MHLLGNPGQGHKDLLNHERLIVLVDANSRTGRRGEGTLGSNHGGVLSVYGRDTCNDNGEFLLAFASNHYRAPFWFPQKGQAQQKRIKYILTIVRNVVVRPQPSFLPISDHNVMVVHVRLLGQFPRQPLGMKGYKANPQLAKTDDALSTPGTSGNNNQSPPSSFDPE